MSAHSTGWDEAREQIDQHEGWKQEMGVEPTGRHVKEEQK